VAAKSEYSNAAKATSSTDNSTARWFTSRCYAGESSNSSVIAESVGGCAAAKFVSSSASATKSVSTTADAKFHTNAAAKAVSRGAAESVFISTAKSRSSAAAEF
ncbi:hypothetical protein JG688_00016359, partial [Phytophthora aleatoria]